MGEVISKKKLILEDLELSEEEKRELERRFYDFLEGKNIMDGEELKNWLKKELER